MQATINLTPKQTDAWELYEDDHTTEIGFGGAAGGGKGLTLNTPVLCDTGWKKAGDITMNDKLVSVDGTYTEIMGIFPQGLKQTYKFTFDDGIEVIVDGSHLWKVWNSDHGQRDGWIIKDTETLFNSKGRYSIPLLDNPAPGNYVPTYDPYIIGYILGDGTMTGHHPTIYTADEWVTDYLRQNGWKIYKYKESVWQCALSSNKSALYSELQKNSKQAKRVPKNLLNGTPEVRLAVLQGLMDSDGTVYKDGSCSYSTLVDGLAEDVVYLVRSLGGKASIEIKKRIMASGYTEKDVRVSHCGRFIPFRLPRKKEKVKAAVYDKRYIKRIEKMGIEETVCFAVSHPSKLFVIDGFVVTHNSRIGWYLMVFGYAEKYPGSRCAVGRKELKTLRITTLAELFIIFQELGYKDIKDYTFDAKDNIIKFPNGSEIILLDTAYSPQDPEYTRFGSLNLTAAWIEESNETPEKAKSILKTRVGRHNKFIIDGEEVIAKALWFETFNPNKGHVHRDYYKPWKEGTLPAYRAFIRALPGDNPHLPEAYIENLKRADKITRERLLFGNFDFDSDPTKIMDYEAITDLRTNTIDTDGELYMVNDIARFGGDKIVLGYFNGFKLYGLEVYTYQDTDITKQRIKDGAIKHQIPYSHIISDEDGIGGGVVDGLKGTKGFIGNATPFQIFDTKTSRFITANFTNLRSQCYFKLGEYVNAHKMSIDVEFFETNIDGYTLEKALSDMEEELDAIKRKDMSGQNTKLSIIPKDEIKEHLGRSPDFADMFMMRMYFIFHKQESTEERRHKESRVIIKRRSYTNQAL